MAFQVLCQVLEIQECTEAAQTAVLTTLTPSSRDIDKNTFKIHMPVVVSVVEKNQAE